MARTQVRSRRKIEKPAAGRKGGDARSSRSGKSTARTQNPQDLEDVLESLHDIAEKNGGACIEDIQDRVGSRSFGPLLVIAGLVAATPMGAIPGVPSLMGLMVVLIAGQLMIGKTRFWLPEKLRTGEVDPDKLKKSISIVMPVARFVDRFLRPRLTFFTESPFIYITAGLCVFTALMIPPLEIIPMAAAVPATAIVALGLAIVARDGVLALIAGAFCLGSIYLVVTQLLL